MTDHAQGFSASRRASGQYADSFCGESKSQVVSSSRHWIVDCISDPIPRHAAAATPRTIAVTGAAAATEAMAEAARKATITMMTTMIAGTGNLPLSDADLALPCPSASVTVVAAGSGSFAHTPLGSSETQRVGFAFCQTKFSKAVDESSTTPFIEKAELASRR